MSQNVYDVSVQSRLFRLAPAAAISIRLETSELLVTPGSKITFVRFLHSSNAKLSIFSIVGGSVIFFNSVLPANAELGISFLFQFLFQILLFQDCHILQMLTL